MRETTNMPLCDSTEALVAYLYGEANKDEAKEFEQHLRDCTSCRDEFAAFGQVREAVSGWRADALRDTPSLAFESGVLQPAIPAPGSVQKRSALVALREFFALSPLWLRAASVAATVVICALAALAVVNAEIRWDNDGLAFRTGLHGSRQQDTDRIAQPPVSSTYTQEQVNELVAQRDAAQRELAAARNQIKDREEIAASGIGEGQKASMRTVATPVTTSQRRNTKRPETVIPVAAPRMQPQLASDKRDEEDLPRLYDLLNEVN